MAYTSIKTVIQNKLKALVDSNSKTYLKDVYIYNANKPTGFPYATVVQSISEGEIIDNTRVERVYEISVKVFQEISEDGKTNSEAMALMTILEDKIIEMFDNDRQLKVDGVATLRRLS